MAADRFQPAGIVQEEPPLWERLAAGFVVFMLTGALIAPVLAPDQGETPILRLIWIPVYAVTAGLVAFRFDKVILTKGAVAKFEEMMK